MKIFICALHPKGHWRLGRKWPAEVTEMEVSGVLLVDLRQDPELVLGQSAEEVEARRQQRVGEAQAEEIELRLRATQDERDERRGGARRSEASQVARNVFGHD